MSGAAAGAILDLLGSDVTLLMVLRNPFHQVKSPLYLRFSIYFSFDDDMSTFSPTFLRFFVYSTTPPVHSAPSPFFVFLISLSIITGVFQTRWKIAQQRSSFIRSQVLD